MRYRSLLIAQMLALASLACSSPLAPEGAVRIAPNAVTDAAALRVEACAAREGLRAVRSYGSLRLWLDPETLLGGHGRGRDAFVRTELAGASVLWAHEFLHLLHGFPGKTATDHPPVFWRCGLDPRQI